MKHIIEGKVEGKRRRWRRGKQILDERKEKRRYWKLMMAVLDSILCRTGFGRGCGHVIQTTWWWWWWWWWTG